MLKQSVGSPAMNLGDRFDMGYAYTHWYPQRPVADTIVSRSRKIQEMPMGENLLIAIGSYDGLSQEDAIVRSQAAVDRGSGRITVHRIFKAVVHKISSSDYEAFESPLATMNGLGCIGVRAECDYTKLDYSGLLEEGTYVKNGDVLIGRILYTTDDSGNRVRRDRSIILTCEDGEYFVVDRVMITTNRDGFRQVRVKLRSMRVPQIGDKISDRHGQKGVIGFLARQEDLPFVADGPNAGMTPDAIVNLHCFAEDDHEVLTERGFMSLAELERDDTWRHTRIAGFNETGGTLVYEYASRLVIKPHGQHAMVRFEHNSAHCNGVSLLVTDDHSMYAKTGTAYVNHNGKQGIAWAGRQVGPRGASRRIADGFSKVSAASLVSESPRAAVKLLAHAAFGSAPEVPDLFGRLGLDSDLRRTAFCEFYGYWLGDGCISGSRVMCSPAKEYDDCWLAERLDAVGLRSSDDFVRTVCGEAPRRYCWYIKNAAWCAAFDEEYGVKYACSSATASKSGTVPEPIKSAKWLAPWAWDLPSDLCRAILAGLRCADGSEAGNLNIIWTSSARFRDEVVRLALHAGYSATASRVYKAGEVRSLVNGAPVVAKHDGWRVNYADSLAYSEPVLHAARDIQRVAYGGRTWCLTMPSGFLVARSLLRDPSGAVCGASRPLIVGNCVNGRMTIGKLLEMLYSNLGLAEASFVDASPFRDLDATWAIQKLLEAGYGTESYMIDGRSGRMMASPWFVGSCFYQSLKHMVFDKIAARNRGPRAVLTRQPLEGRAKQGGLRVGEMERDAFLAHGASMTLDDRSRVASDGHVAPVCTRCGQIGETSTKFTLKGLLGSGTDSGSTEGGSTDGAVSGTLDHQECCRICGGPIQRINTTYCYSNLLVRELATVGIKVEHYFDDSGVPSSSDEGQYVVEPLAPAAVTALASSLDDLDLS